MTFLLDTMVASDNAKSGRDPRVQAWLYEQDRRDLFLSVVTLGEISLGIERLASGRKRAFLETWRGELLDEFQGQILAVDETVAQVWGRVRRRCEQASRTMPVSDAFLAATAEVHGLTIVTRNIRDFEAWGGPVFDPWSQASI